MVSSVVESLYTTIYSQAHSQSHGIILAGRNDGKLLVYNVSGLLEREEGGGVRGERPLGPQGSVKISPHPVYSLAHTADFAVAGSSGTISGFRWSELKECNNTKPVWSISLDSDQSSFGTPEVNSLCYNNSTGNSQLLWAACGDWKTRAYDLETGKLVTSLDGHKDYVHQVTASGNDVITCGEDGAVLVWDSRTPGEPRTSILPHEHQQLQRPQHGKFISSVDYAGGEWLVCGGGPRAAVFHLRSAGLITTLPPSDLDTPVTVAMFTKRDDASSIATAGADGGFVYVCNLSGQLTAKLPTSARCVYTVVASYDKHTLMSIGGYSSKIDMCLNLSYRDHSVTTICD
uniref:THO complex subunit 6 homolog n=1 Tax=Hirondellea gigas TaxID=1518452 RepID=A0A2P2I2J2_9CRUS